MFTNRRDTAHNAYKVKVPMGTYGVAGTLDFSPLIARSFDLVKNSVRGTQFDGHKLKFERASFDRISNGIVVVGTLKFTGMASSGKNRKAGSFQVKVISGVPVPPQYFCDSHGNEYKIDRTGVAKFLGIEHSITKPKSHDNVFYEIDPILASSNSRVIVADCGVCPGDKPKQKKMRKEMDKPGLDQSTLHGDSGSVAWDQLNQWRQMDPATGSMVPALCQGCSGSLTQNPDGSYQACKNCATKKTLITSPSPYQSSTSGPNQPSANLSADTRMAILGSVTKYSKLVKLATDITASNAVYNDLVYIREQSDQDVPTIKCGHKWCANDANMYASTNGSILVKCGCGFEKYYSADSLDDAVVEVPSYGISEDIWMRIEDEYQKCLARGCSHDDDRFVCAVGAIISDHLMPSASDAKNVMGMRRTAAYSEDEITSADVYLSREHRINKFCSDCRLYIPMGHDGSIANRDTCGLWRTPIDNVRTLGKKIDHCVPTIAFVSMQGDVRTASGGEYIMTDDDIYKITVASYGINKTTIMIEAGMVSDYISQAVALYPSAEHPFRSGVGSFMARPDVQDGLKAVYNTMYRIKQQSPGNLDLPDNYEKLISDVTWAAQEGMALILIRRPDNSYYVHNMNFRSIANEWAEGLAQKLGMTPAQAAEAAGFSLAQKEQTNMDVMSEVANKS